MKSSRLLCIVVLNTIGVVDLGSARAQPVVVPQNENIPSQIRFLAAGILDARGKFKSDQATIEYHEVLPSQWLYPKKPVGGEGKENPAANRVTNRVAQWRIKDSNLAVFIKSDPNDVGGVLNYKRFVSDGRQIRQLFAYDDSKTKPGGGPYYFGGVGAAEEGFRHGLLRTEENYDPRAYAFYTYPGGKPLDEAILTNNPPAVFGGETTIEGSKCMRVDLPGGAFTYSFWVDIEHGFIIRRREEHIKLAEKTILKRIVRTPQIIESKGKWLPAIVEQKNYFTAYPVTEPPGLPDDAQVPYILRRVTISNFKAECDSVPEAFILDWPLGTNLTDTLYQKQYVITATGGDKAKKNAPSGANKKEVTPQKSLNAPEPEK